MRPTRILLVAGLSIATAFPTPANALAGVCVVSSTGINRTCVPPQVVCDPGDLITVITIGHGTGMARCGGATASCPANGACADNATASLRNALDCSIDPWGTDDVVAICLVTPGART